METQLQNALRKLDYGCLHEQAEAIFAAEQAFRELREAKDRGRTEFDNAIDVYELARFELLQRRWKEASKGWCTNCETIVDAASLAPQYTEGQEWRGNEYTERVADFKYIHQACPTCREKLLERSGAENDSGTTRFWAFKTEKRGDGFWICRFGNWVPAPEDAHVGKFDRGYLSGDIAKAWDLPPSIERTFNNYHELLQVSS